MATRKGNSKDYWEDRELQESQVFGEIEGIIKREKTVIEKEKKIYSQALAELDKELDDLKKDVGEDAITKAALRKPMTAKDLEQWSIRQQNRLGDLIDEFGDEEGRKIFGMENAETGKQDRANRVVRRQETLRKSIDAIANGAAAKTEKETRKALEKEAEKGVESFQNQLPASLKANARAEFDTVDEGTVTRAAQSIFKAEDFSERIWANRDVLVKDLERSIGLAVTNGWSIPRLAKEFEHNVAVDERSAERIARTEMNRVSNAAELAQYREKGIKFYRFIATEDARTCEICGQIHDKVFSVDDATTGANFPPVHPNCRCRTVISSVDEEGKEDLSWLDDMQSEIDNLQAEFDEMDEADAEEESKAEEQRKAEEESKAEEKRKAEDADAIDKKQLKADAKRLFDKTYEIKDVNGNVAWRGNAEQFCYSLYDTLLTASISQLKDIENSNNENVRESLKIRRDIEQFIKKYAIKEGIYHINENSSYHLTAKDLKAIGVPANLANIIKECDYWLSKIKDSDLEENAKEYQKKEEEARNVEESRKNKPVIDDEHYDLIEEIIENQNVHRTIPKGTIVAMAADNDFSGRKDLDDLYPENDVHKKCFTHEQVNALEKSLRDANKDIQITPENLPSTMLYVDGGYKMINVLNRNQISVHEEIDKYNKKHKNNRISLTMLNQLSNQLSNEIKKFTVPEPITVKRLLNNAKFLTMGLTNKTTLGYLIGREFTDKGFVSTSINLNYNGKIGGYSPNKVVMYIDVPAGAHAAYIAGIGGKYPNQKEFLLDKGTRFRIIDAGERTAGNQNGKPVTELFIHAEVVL